MSQSEKKYKTKAAQEYRRHLSKGVVEGEHGHHQDSEEQHHATKPLLAVGKETAATTVFTSVIATAATEPSYISTAKPIGTLDVSAVSALDKEESSTFFHDADPLKLLSKAGGIKKSSLSGTKKPGLGAKRLTTSSSADTKLESFESLEKRNDSKSRQDQQLSVSLQDMNISEVSSGRVAALLREEDTPSGSLYRNSTEPSKSSFVSVSSNQTHNRPLSNPNESFAARDKYSNVKGISSDQFFGRDEEGNQAVRSKLQTQYGSSTGISSDMLYGANDGEENSDFHTGTAAEGISLDKLKDSVSGFFENIQRRIG